MVSLSSMLLRAALEQGRTWWALATSVSASARRTPGTAIDGPVEAHLFRRSGAGCDGRHRVNGHLPPAVRGDEFHGAKEAGRIASGKQHCGIGTVAAEAAQYLRRRQAHFKRNVLSSWRSDHRGCLQPDSGLAIARPPTRRHLSSRVGGNSHRPDVLATRSIKRATSLGLER